MNIYKKEFEFNHLETIQVKNFTDCKHLFVLGSNDYLKIIHCYKRCLIENLDEFKIILNDINYRNLKI